MKCHLNWDILPASWPLSAFGSGVISSPRANRNSDDGMETKRVIPFVFELDLWKTLFEVHVERSSHCWLSDKRHANDCDAVYRLTFNRGMDTQVFTWHSSPSARLPCKLHWCCDMHTEIHIFVNFSRISAIAALFECAIAKLSTF